LPKKRPRRRIASNRPRAYTPFKANAVWAYDFVFDTTAEGQQIKCLTVIDEYTRECLAIDVADSIRSRRVVEVLSQLVSIHGAPLFMRSDNVLNARGVPTNGNGIACRSCGANRHLTKSNEQNRRRGSAAQGSLG
jgi:transposase InsO family protein